MGAQFIAPSSSLQLQWPRQKIKPQQLSINSPYVHRNHRDHQYAHISCICWCRKKRILLFPLEKSAFTRSRTSASNGAGDPGDEPGDNLTDDEHNDCGNGTIAGATAMIIGTSIGSGILALPQRTSPAGFLPTSISITICWCFLLVEALLLVEVNADLLSRKRKRKKEVGNGNGNGNELLEVVSIRTMARETLGEWGGALATITYVFLGYSSMVAYCSKSGEILLSLINLPASASGCFFTALFTVLIVIGGTQTTDHVNQWLTASMIGLLLAIEVVAVAFGGWAGPGSGGYWSEVPPTIPVIIFSLVYHDVAPVVCAYLEGDIARIRTSVIVGSLVPLVALLVWEAIALGLSSSLPDQVVDDPVELLTRVRWSGVPLMVQAFSLLAVGTSMIGTLLGFSEFFKEQLSHVNISSNSHLIQVSKPAMMELEQQSSNGHLELRRWCVRNRISLIAMVLVVCPSLFLSTMFPDAFTAATDVAGGYCMTMLYGVLPPAMAWAMHTKKDALAHQTTLSTSRPALVVVGICACGIVVEEILQDFSMLNPFSN